MIRPLPARLAAAGHEGFDLPPLRVRELPSPHHTASCPANHEIHPTNQEPSETAQAFSRQCACSLPVSLSSSPPGWVISPPRRAYTPDR